jgi:hypothetical protein
MRVCVNVATSQKLTADACGVGPRTVNSVTSLYL